MGIADFIVCEGFNIPPFRAFIKVLNPETNTLPKQHTSPFKVRLLIAEHMTRYIIGGMSANTAAEFTQGELIEVVKLHAR